ncbi:MAG TPA: hypothetical protein VGX00_02265 [Thermoplasmata archaeon]|nr:hypothetical protein [Thermoplasmata archaeon]
MKFLSMSWVSMTFAIAVIALGVGATVSVPGSVAYEHLLASPSTVGPPGDVPNASATCPSAARGWTCSLTVSESSSSNRAAAWTASSTAHASFAPKNGTLHPGGSVTVKVTITSCGGRYALDFAGPQNTATATFTCG